MGQAGCVRGAAWAVEAASAAIGLDDAPAFGRLLGADMDKLTARHRKLTLRLRLEVGEHVRAEGHSEEMGSSHAHAVKSKRGHRSRS